MMKGRFKLRNSTSFQATLEITGLCGGKAAPPLPASFFYWTTKTNHFGCSVWVLEVRTKSPVCLIFFFFSPPHSDVLIADVSSVRAGQAPLVSGLRPNSISPLHSAKWSEGLIHRSLINRWSSDELVLQWGRPEVIHLRFMPGAPKYKQIRGIILYNTRYNTAAGPSTCVFVYQYASMIPKHAGTTWVLAISVL